MLEETAMGENAMSTNTERLADRMLPWGRQQAAQKCIPWPIAFNIRVKDAQRLLRLGVPRREVQAIHGRIVLEAAES